MQVPIPSDVMKSDVIKLDSAQSELAVQSLAQAFAETAIFNVFLPEDLLRQAIVRQQFCRTLVNYAQVYNHSYTVIDRMTGQLQGSALWIPPEGLPDSLWRWLRSGGFEFLLQIEWRKLPTLLSIFFSLDVLPKAKLKQPYWYLMMLGVTPEFQGQGIGSQLLQPVLEQADRQGMICYLETSNEAAVRLYQRHGFEVHYSGLAHQNFNYWTMIRQPQGRTTNV
jgi:ribosomal protein S18 acetylase RimI-like enzyme